MPVVDAGIKDRDAHTLPIQQAATGKRGQRLAGTGPGLQKAPLAGRGAVGGDADHVGAPGQRVESGSGHHGRNRANRDVVVEHRPAARQDVLAKRHQRRIGAGRVDQHFDVLLATQAPGPGDRRKGASTGHRRDVVAQIGGQLQAADALCMREVRPQDQGRPRQHRGEQASEEGSSDDHRGASCRVQGATARPGKNHLGLPSTFRHESIAALGQCVK